MTCPKCSHPQPEGEAACEKCGVIFAKLSAAPKIVAVGKPVPAATEGWAPFFGKLLFVGALLAGVAAVWFLLLVPGIGSRY